LYDSRVSYDFPDTLVQLQRDAAQADRELRDLYAQLPHRPMPMPKPYTDVHGVQHDASPGWTDEGQAAVDGLMERRRQAHAAVVMHEIWATLSGTDVPKARMALKHVDPEPADA
jgi:hypothetical protein